MEAGSEYDGAADHRIYPSTDRIWTGGLIRGGRAKGRVKNLFKSAGFHVS
jgi:hypothetical protein